MKKLLPLLLLLALAGGGVWWYRTTHRPGPLSFTGFVEGEEKIVKSEISGRVTTVAFTDGAHVKQGEIGRAHV